MQSSLCNCRDHYAHFDIGYHHQNSHYIHFTSIVLSACPATRFVQTADQSLQAAQPADSQSLVSKHSNHHHHHCHHCHHHCRRTFMYVSLSMSLFLSLFLILGRTLTSFSLSFSHHNPLPCSSACSKLLL